MAGPIVYLTNRYAPLFIAYDVVADQRVHVETSDADGSIALLKVGAVSADGSLIGGVGQSQNDWAHRLNVWDTTNFQEVFSLAGEPWLSEGSAPKAFAFSGDNTKVAYATDRSDMSPVVVIDLETGTQYAFAEDMTTLANRPQDTTALQFSGDGSILYIGSRVSTVGGPSFLAYDLEANAIIKRFTASETHNEVSVSPTGRFFTIPKNDVTGFTVTDTTTDTTQTIDYPPASGTRDKMIGPVFTYEDETKAVIGLNDAVSEYDYYYGGYTFVLQTTFALVDLVAGTYSYPAALTTSGDNAAQLAVAGEGTFWWTAREYSSEAPLFRAFSDFSPVGVGVGTSVLDYVEGMLISQDVVYVPEPTDTTLTQAITTNTGVPITAWWMVPVGGGKPIKATRNEPDETYTVTVPFGDYYSVYYTAGAPPTVHGPYTVSE